MCTRNVRTEDEVVITLTVYIYDGIVLAVKESF